MWWSCKGCTARDGEIARLVAEKDALLNRLMLAVDKPQAVMESSVPDTAEPEVPAEAPVDPFLDAANALRKHAQERGLDVREFADA